METAGSQTDLTFSTESPQTEVFIMETEMPEEVHKTDLTRLHDLAILHNLHVQFKELKHIGTPQARIFQMELRVGEFVGIGSGATKKKAKLQASKEVVSKLAKLPVPETATPYWSRPHTDLVDIKDRQYFFFDKNPVCALVEVLTVRREKAPEFTNIKTTYKGHVPWYTVEVRVGEMTAQAEAPHKKKIAKEMAAERMLEMMGFGEQMKRDQLLAQGHQRAFIAPFRSAHAPRPVKLPPTTATWTNPPEVLQVAVDNGPKEVKSKLSEVTQGSSSALPSPSQKPEVIPSNPQVFTPEQLMTPQDLTRSADSVTPAEGAVPEVPTSEHEQFSTPLTIPDPTEPFILVEDSTPPEDIPEPETLSPVDHVSPTGGLVPPEDFMEAEAQQFSMPLDLTSSAEPTPAEDFPYALEDFTNPEDSPYALEEFTNPEDAPYALEDVTNPEDVPYALEDVTNPEDFPYALEDFTNPEDAPYALEDVTNPEDVPYALEDVTNPEDFPYALEDFTDPEDAPYALEDVTNPQDFPYALEDFTDPEDAPYALEDFTDLAVSSAPQPTQLYLAQQDLSAAGSLTVASAHSLSCTYPQESVVPQSSSTAHSMVKAMAKKLLQKSPVSLDTQQQVDLVHRLREVESRVLVPENLELRAKMLKTIGKAAAKGLLLEFGSSSTLLSQSEEDFIEATVKHLQVHIKSSLNHTLNAKPWHKRVLSKVFKRNRFPAGAFSEYLSSEPKL